MLYQGDIDFSIFHFRVSFFIAGTVRSFMPIAAMKNETLK